MANGASRVFEIFKNTSENVVGNENQFVSLSVKTLEPLTFTLDDKVIITKDLYILDVNFSIENLQVNDAVNALLLNKGQVFYILGNTKQIGQWKVLATNVPYATNVELPNDFNEIYVEVKVRYDYIPFIIPKIIFDGLSGSETKAYRLGEYAFNGANMGTTLQLFHKKIKFWDTYLNTNDVNEYSSMDIYYR